MARTSRNNMKDSSFFHIMVQGMNKEYIFDKQKDKEKYLKLINENNKNIEIIAYCIMGNHAHFLTQTNTIVDLENWMKRVNTGYAMYYNKKNNRVGYVFKDRYKSQPIKNIKHFYLCVNYIHNNPVKAKICNEMEDYEFSSYNAIYNSSQNNVYKKISQMFQDKSFIKETTEDDENFKFIDDEKEDKEYICNQIIKKFLIIEEISIEELKEGKKQLKKLVEILKNENNMSYRIMEKCLGISREKLRKLIINSKNEM